MVADILEQKLATYEIANEIEQELALQEIIQLYVLSALATTDFFEHVAFHGGTFLRLFYGVERFSEDLDFALKTPQSSFQWDTYKQAIESYLDNEGIPASLHDKGSTDVAVKKTFVRTHAIGTTLAVVLPYARDVRKKIHIKIEIDTNPPQGALYDVHYISFPRLASVATFDRASAFAGKVHALLCRTYAKGRDWYDFLWYCNQKTPLNYEMLAHALHQGGPWKGQTLTVDSTWVHEELTKTITSQDWSTLVKDVQRFLPASQQHSLSLWNEELFLYHLKKM